MLINEMQTYLSILNNKVQVPSPLIQDRPNYQEYAESGFGVYRINTQNSLSFERIDQQPPSSEPVILPLWEYNDCDAQETGLVTLTLKGWKILHVTDDQLLQRVASIFPEKL